QQHIVLRGQCKQPDQIDGIVTKDILILEGYPAILDAEIAGRAQLCAGAPGEWRQKAVQLRHALELLHLETRTDDARQIADILGNQKVVLHEALDGYERTAAAVMQALGHQRLHIEGEPFLGFAREEMQMTADRPEKVLAAPIKAVLRGGEKAGFHPVL